MKTGSGKNKSAYSYLESVPEEKAMIQKLYEIFAATRSIKKTADKMNELGYRTKVGSSSQYFHNKTSFEKIPYRTADESAYNYFLEHNGGLCGDVSDFDGQHGISAYNKTDQEKFEDADSTFISPKFVQLMSQSRFRMDYLRLADTRALFQVGNGLTRRICWTILPKNTTARIERPMPLLAGLVYCPH